MDRHGQIAGGAVPGATHTYVALERRYGTVMTPTELAHELGIAVRTLHNRASRGTLPVPSMRVGHLRRFRSVDVAAFIDRGGE